ncbi:MAG: hypothetical protein WBR15_02885 [Gammaproteobacteria bacterium]
MINLCRHCGESYPPNENPPWGCPHCGKADWLEHWKVETRSQIVSRLKAAVLDILRGSPFAGVGQDPSGHYIAMIPMMCDRWLQNPQLYGDFIGTVNDLNQLEAMVFGTNGRAVLRTRAHSSAYRMH